MVALFATYCYKSELSFTTHPDKGMVVINKILPDGATLPAEGFTILFNGKSYISTSTTTTIDDVVEPGVYTAYIYSNTTEMSIAHDIDTWGEGTIISSKVVDSGNSVESLTQDLYFGTETITVLADQVIYSDVELWQVTRDIYFNFEITEGNASDIVVKDATLIGIAGQWECVADEPIGNAVNICPTLSLTESLTPTKSTEVVANHLTGSIKVLGIKGDSQVLTINLTLMDGSMQTEMIDVSEKLSGSNDTKSTPITLSDDIDTPIESTVDGEIGGWGEGTGGEETVN